MTHQHFSSGPPPQAGISEAGTRPGGRARAGRSAAAERPRLTDPGVPHQPQRGGDGPQETAGAEHRAAAVEPVQPEAAPEPPDPLEHPDPLAAADAAAIENLLRCWIRETGTPRPAGPSLRLPLDASGGALRIPVRYWSATGCHRFGTPVLEHAPAGAPPVDAVTLATLLRREAVHQAAVARGAGAGGEAAAGEAAPGEAAAGEAASGEGAAGEGAAEMIGRVANSVRCTAAFLRDRRAHPVSPHDVRFLDAEQALVLGHPLHPTPKSREGLSEAQTRVYSPELRGAFPLHWIAVHRTVLDSDSAWTERGRPVTAERIAADLAECPLELPSDTVPVPVHPWQARELRGRPDVAALLAAGLLHDLGPRGPHWYPTSSVRTVYRPGADAMLKLSLGVRITNSRRENLRKELERGVEVHRLLRTGLAEEWQAAYPGFDIVRDPAWLAVTGADGRPVRGLDVVIRHNPFQPADAAYCVAGLTSPRPWPGHAGMRSQLADVIDALTARTGRPADAVATEWFLRYLQAVVRPVLWLDGTAGVALEAHQQNTVVVLDTDGWPAGGRYRDNQGYYFRESRRRELDRRLPGIGISSDTFVPDAVTDERFAYYLGINNVLGLIGAFGSQGLADEGILLAAFRRFLATAAADPQAHRSRLPALLLDTPTLRCKANLLTRLHGLDELVGPVDTQSVYVTIPNPLAS